MDYSKYSLYGTGDSAAEVAALSSVGTASASESSTTGETTVDPASSIVGSITSGLSSIFGTYAYLDTADEQQAIAEANAATAASNAQAQQAESSTSLAAYATANPIVVGGTILAILVALVMVAKK